MCRVGCRLKKRVIRCNYLAMSVLRRAVCLCSPPAAFQPPCCLPQPRTKHIAAPEQHGVLSYLPAAAAVLAPDAPVLSCPRCPGCAVTDAAGPATCQEPALGQRMYCTTTPPTCPTAAACPRPRGRLGAPTLYLVLGLDLKRKC